ncbi:uncharacterized protein igl isoform X1 [Drosophila bipectinata]|uniref:uncharacterized protein igl isoform X1 n=2 Tax=Drosophila bipectinata TaxID=42026 RepID=UPI001C8A340A|nr:uncharacterized protein LOC108133259 isoform X1 [Drosophila bipectinata]KAH8275614.1 hypothetical protein KR026_011746 [Drosophila bipectinata]
MGCNTSQELKTKDGAAIDAVSNGDAEPSAPPLEGDSGSKSSNNHTNHAKSNSIISNGDAKAANGGGSAGGKSEATNGIDRPCDKAAITEFNDEEDEAKAATKIQAVYRGHKVRETMKKSETKTATNNGTATGAAPSADAAGAAASLEPTKAELEAEFDPNDKELCHAALKIQSTFRGHLARKLVNKDAPEDEDIQEITKKVAEELDIDLTDPELNKAATKIQASFRGHKLRKETNPE